jgi:hypothetical protein
MTNSANAPIIRGRCITPHKQADRAWICHVLFASTSYFVFFLVGCCGLLLQCPESAWVWRVWTCNWRSRNVKCLGLNKTSCATAKDPELACAYSKDVVYFSILPFLDCIGIHRSCIESMRCGRSALYVPRSQMITLVRYSYSTTIGITNCSHVPRSTPSRTIWSSLSTYSLSYEYCKWMGPPNKTCNRFYSHSYSTRILAGRRTYEEKWTHPNISRTSSIKDVESCFPHQKEFPCRNGSFLQIRCVTSTRSTLSFLQCRSVTLTRSTSS